MTSFFFLGIYSSVIILKLKEKKIIILDLSIFLETKRLSILGDFKFEFELFQFLLIFLFAISMNDYKNYAGKV